MKPGMYKMGQEYGGYMTVFPDGLGWNWEKFHNGHEDRGCEDGWKFINSRGDWTVKSSTLDRVDIDSYISPFELVRW